MFEAIAVALIALALAIGFMLGHKIGYTAGADDSQFKYQGQPIWAGDFLKRRPDLLARSFKTIHHYLEGSGSYRLFLCLAELEHPTEKDVNTVFLFRFDRNPTERFILIFEPDDGRAWPAPIKDGPKT